MVVKNPGTITGDWESPLGEIPNAFDREANPAGVLPWRLEHAAYLARQFSTPTIYGQKRQVRRLEKRQGKIRTVPRTRRKRFRWERPPR